VAKKPTRFGRLARFGLIAVLVTSTAAFGADQVDTIDDLDDLFAAVAMRMPEFGGMYVDEENDTLVRHEAW
jgi:hypothetical protein